jgi:hypothetical protein
MFQTIVIATYYNENMEYATIIPILYQLEEILETPKTIQLYTPSGVSSLQISTWKLMNYFNDVTCTIC